MKNITFNIILFLTFVYSQSIYSQIPTPTQTSIALSKNNPKVGETIDIIIKTDIEKDWYIYATKKDEAVMPVLAKLELARHSSFKQVGKFRAINPKERYEKIWPGSYTYFEEKGEFRQTIKILEEDYNISGKYSYMVCSNEGMCIIDKTDFSFQGK